MVDQRLVEYIRKEEHDGFSDQQLHDFLISKGYNAVDVQAAIAAARPKPASGQAPATPAAATSQPVASQPASSGPGFKKRNVVVQLLLAMVTFGIWALVWLVKMSKELKRNGFGNDLNPNMLWLLLVPFANVVVMIIYMLRLSDAVSQATGYSKSTLAVLLILLGPIGMIIAQVQLNKLAK